MIHSLTSCHLSAGTGRERISAEKGGQEELQRDVRALEEEGGACWEEVLRADKSREDGGMEEVKLWRAGHQQVGGLQGLRE